MKTCKICNENYEYFKNTDYYNVELASNCFILNESVIEFELIM